MRNAQVQIIPGRDFDDDLWIKWDDIWRSNRQLASPLFSPTFTQIVSTVRADVEVAVISVGGEIVAFFPFHRERNNTRRAQPAADFMAAFDGVICRPDFDCDLLDLIGDCGLARYDFRKCVGLERAFEPFHRAHEDSAQIDLSEGFDAYVRQKRAAGSGLFKQCANLARRMEREVGALRFVAHSQDRSLLHRVLSMKASQYIRTGIENFMSHRWLVDVVERMHATCTEGFSGTLSLLYAGDRLVAGHFGVRSPTVWHYWMPAYDVEMAKYSPGMNLLLRMAEHAPSVGLQTIDLGRANVAYKQRLMNRCFVVAGGSVRRPSRLGNLVQKVLPPRRGAVGNSAGALGRRVG